MDDADIRPRARRGARLLAIAVAATVPLACGRSGPAMGRVSGRVTYAGKPVPKGTIAFLPVADGPVAVGELDTDGSYRLQTGQPGDGVLLGYYNVTISAHDDPILDYLSNNSAPKLLVPAKYELIKTTDLQVRVRAGSNTIDFDLKD